MVADQVDGRLAARPASDEAWRWVVRRQGRVQRRADERRPPRHRRHPPPQAGRARSSSSRRRCAASCATTPTTSRCRSSLDDGAQDETLNQAAALWTRPQSRDHAEQHYAEFYRHVAHAFDEPWATLHWRAEGMLEYTGLVYSSRRRSRSTSSHPDRKPRREASTSAASSSPTAPTSCCRAGCASCRASSTARTCRSTSAARCCRTIRWCAKIGQGVITAVLAELEKKAQRRARRLRQVLGDFGAVLKEGLSRGPRAPRHADEPAALPLDARATAGQPRASMSAHEGRPARDLLRHRRGPEDAARRPQLEGYSSARASRCCC